MAATATLESETELETFSMLRGQVIPIRILMRLEPKRLINYVLTTDKVSGRPKVGLLIECADGMQALLDAQGSGPLAASFFWERSIYVFTEPGVAWAKALKLYSFSLWQVPTAEIQAKFKMFIVGRLGL